MKESLRKRTNANFNVAQCHPWIDSERFIVDSEVTDATLIVLTSLHAANFFHVWMTSKEKWTSCSNRFVISGITDIWFRLKSIDIDRDDVFCFGDRNCGKKKCRIIKYVNNFSKKKSYLYAIRHHKVIYPSLRRKQ